LVALALAGCNSGDGSKPEPKPPAPRPIAAAGLDRQLHALDRIARDDGGDRAAGTNG